MKAIAVLAALILVSLSLTKSSEDVPLVPVTSTTVAATLPAVPTEEKVKPSKEPVVDEPVDEDPEEEADVEDDEEAVAKLGKPSKRSKGAKPVCYLDVPYGKAARVGNITCSDCQWECLGNPDCQGLNYNGTYLTQLELSTWDCGDARWPSVSLGLCVQVMYSNSTDDDVVVYNTMEVDCAECTNKCIADDKDKCAGLYFNYNAAWVNETTGQPEYLENFCSQDYESATFAG